MKITAYLIAGLPGEPETEAHIAGDVLTVDGTPYDLSSVPEGGIATPEGESPFVGSITRTNGEIVAAVRWQYDAATALDDQGSEHPVMDVVNGPVTDPVHRKPVTDPEVE